MTPSWLRRTSIVPPTLLALVLVSGCGADSSDDAGTGVGVSTTGTATPTADPGATPTPTTTPRSSSAVGTVVVNTALGVNALESDQSLATHVEVTDAEALATTYDGVPGIDAVVAAVADSPLATGDRLFVYVVAACITDDVALRVRGSEVVMVVSGTSTLKCEPPPLQMVVWRLGADEVPADAVPGQAIQK